MRRRFPIACMKHTTTIKFCPTCPSKSDFSKPIDSRLILSKTHMWVLYVDVVVLQYDGNIIDAASLGVCFPALID